MVGILAYHDQLSPFVEILHDLPQPDGLDTSLLLEAWFMRYIEEYISAKFDMCEGLAQLLDGRVLQPQRNVSVRNIGGIDTEKTVILIEALYGACNTIFKAHSRIHNSGYPAVLTVLLLHLCLPSSEK